jgi:hypothetical protein
MFISTDPYCQIQLLTSPTRNRLPSTNPQNVAANSTICGTVGVTAWPSTAVVKYTESTKNSCKSDTSCSSYLHFCTFPGRWPWNRLWRFVNFVVRFSLKIAQVQANKTKKVNPNRTLHLRVICFLQIMPYIQTDILITIHAKYLYRLLLVKTRCSITHEIVTDCHFVMCTNNGILTLIAFYGWHFQNFYMHAG